MKKEKIIECKEVIAEMSDNPDNFAIKIPYSSKVNIQELTKDDNDPLFVTVEVINDCISRNKNKYTSDTLQQIQEQINSNLPVGFRGHIPENERQDKSPHPETIWLGSILKNIEGKQRLFAKGYVLPYAKELKTYLKKAKAIGKKVAVSIYGLARKVWNPSSKIYDISDFNLESIDWARPGAEGVTGMGYLSLAKEMKGDSIMEKEKVIKEMSISDLKQHNENLFNEVIKKGYDKAESDFSKDKALVKEMLDLKTELGVDEKENTKELVAEMKREREELVDNYIDVKIAKSISNSAIRDVIKKVIVSEMKGQDITKSIADKTIDGVLSSDEGKYLIKEMANSTKIITSVNNNKTKVKSYKFIKD